MISVSALGWPGSVLLSHALRRSTIGAEGFHGRVRNGIGWAPLAMATRPAKRRYGEIIVCVKQFKLLGIKSVAGRMPEQPALFPVHDDV